MGQIKWNEDKGEYDGDIGKRRREVLFAGLDDAMEVCARPSFGQTKEARAFFRNIHGDLIRIHLGFVNTLEWRQKIEQEDPEAFRMLERIERKWPETGWETSWIKGIGSV